MKNKSAFTLVEIMIVVVIIGLIASMAIPAFQKVRENAIIRKQEMGQRLSPDEVRFLRERKINAHDNAVRRTTVNAENAREIVIDGKTYLLIEKP